MDSSEDNTLATVDTNNLKKRKRKRFWCQDFLKRRDTFSDANSLSELKFAPGDWQKSMGLNEETYLKLLSLVTPIIQKKDTLMREAISPHQRLMATLQYLATASSLQDLTFKTAISTNSLSNIIHETCDAIYKVLHKRYLKFPRTEEEWVNIARDFEQKWNFPHCLGAMDAKHIAIHPSFASGSTYLNRKGSHSMVLLALVDARGELIMCDFGTNGRVLDAGVLKNSKFFQKLRRKELNLPGPAKVGQSDLPYVFVADAAFPLRREVMKPFGQQQADCEERKTYDSRLLRVLGVAEGAFAVLTSHFRILDMAIALQERKIESVVMACCVLHNFLSRSAPECYYRSPLPDGFEGADIGQNHSSSSEIAAAHSQLSALNSLVMGLGENDNAAKTVREGFVNYFATDGRVPRPSTFA